MIRLALLAALAPLASGSAAAQPATATVPATPAAAEQRMAHISVVSVGQGSPVILIPGLSSPRSVWDGVVPDLSKRHRVLLVQVNGFAGDAPGDNLEDGLLDGIVADLSTLIARERLRLPAVVGHSLGGLVAMRLALAHPDRVGRLMTVDTLPFIGPLFGAGDVAAIRPRAAAMRTAIAASAGLPRTQPAGDPGGTLSNTAAGRLRVARWAAAADPRVTAQGVYEAMVTDLRQPIAGIRVPFTALHASGGGAAQAQALWQAGYAGSGARLVMVPDAWHFVMLDQPARFAAELDRFLR